jgi:hypothetical protein
VSQLLPNLACHPPKALRPSAKHTVTRAPATQHQKMNPNRFFIVSHTINVTKFPNFPNFPARYGAVLSRWNYRPKAQSLCRGGVWSIADPIGTSRFRVLKKSLMNSVQHPLSCIRLYFFHGEYSNRLTNEQSCEAPSAIHLLIYKRTEHPPRSITSSPKAHHLILKPFTPTLKAQYS